MPQNKEKERKKREKEGETRFKNWPERPFTERERFPSWRRNLFFFFFVLPFLFIARTRRTLLLEREWTLLLWSFDDTLSLTTRNYNFLKLCHTECGGWYVGFKKRFRAPRNGVATVHHAVSWKHETSPQQYWDFETGFSSAADENTHMDLNTYGIFNDIFQSKINVLHLSKFLRSISWEPRVMIGWASQMDARETLCCHMFLQSKKKGENSRF